MKNLLFISFSIIFISCENIIMEGTDINTMNYSNNNSILLTKSFSSALAKVMANSQDVRSLIKEEALKMFDFDYDILYQSIKTKN